MENKHDHKKCRDLLGSLSEYVDGTLDDSLCLELERHMLDCENCRIVVDTLRKTIILYRANAEPVEIPGDVRQRLYQRLNMQDFIDPQGS